MSHQAVASDPVLVFGATGTHGGAVAHELLARSIPVHAFVRDPGSERARALARNGAMLVVGDLDDGLSIARALSVVPVAYAVTTPFERGADEEIRQGEAIVDAAVKAQLPWLILASVAAAGRAKVPHFQSNLAAMYAFLAGEGYAIDVTALRARYPEVAWTSFAAWAACLNWEAG